jgi:hypothetical protein
MQVPSSPLSCCHPVRDDLRARHAAVGLITKANIILALAGCAEKAMPAADWLAHPSTSWFDSIGHAFNVDRNGARPPPAKAVRKRGQSGAAGLAALGATGRREGTVRG